jgi:ABC-2 type transport system ATP-binding protein
VARGAPAVLKKAVGDEVVKLSFASDEVAARASDALARQAPDRRQEGSELLCYFATAAGRLPELVRALDEAGLALEGLTVSVPTLDDVFLQATGHRLDPRKNGDTPGDGPDGAPGDASAGEGGGS